MAIPRRTERHPRRPLKPRNPFAGILYNTALYIGSVQDILPRSLHWLADELHKLDQHTTVSLQGTGWYATTINGRLILLYRPPTGVTAEFLKAERNRVHEADSNYDVRLNPWPWPDEPDAALETFRILTLGRACR